MGERVPPIDGLYDVYGTPALTNVEQRSARSTAHSDFRKETDHHLAVFIFRALLPKIELRPGLRARNVHLTKY